MTYREPVGFKVKLLYDVKDHWGSGRVWEKGQVIEVDLYGDPPGLMAVQDLVIRGTKVFLADDRYEILDP